MKLLFLILNAAEKARSMAAREWAIAKAQFANFVGQRVIKAMN